VSTFDKTTVIDATHAAITVAARDSAGFGGHAEIYLEMLENGVPTEYFIDMIGVNDAKVLIRTRTLAPGAINQRSGGGFNTHAITPQQGDQALAESAFLKGQAEYGTIKYQYYLPKLSNLNPFESVTYMNCSDFCEKVLQAAGVAVSSGLLSIPKVIANAK
jgi:hypothetical protein